VSTNKEENPSGRGQVGRGEELTSGFSLAVYYVRLNTTVWTKGGILCQM